MENNTWQKKINNKPFLIILIRLAIALVLFYIALTIAFKWIIDMDEEEAKENKNVFQRTVEYIQSDDTEKNTIKDFLFTVKPEEKTINTTEVINLKKGAVYLNAKQETIFFIWSVSYIFTVVIYMFFGLGNEYYFISSRIWKMKTWVIVRIILLMLVCEFTWPIYIVTLPVVTLVRIIKGIVRLIGHKQTKSLSMS